MAEYNQKKIFWKNILRSLFNLAELDFLGELSFAVGSYQKKFAKLIFMIGSYQMKTVKFNFATLGQNRKYKVR